MINIAGIFTGIIDRLVRDELDYFCLKGEEEQAPKPPAEASTSNSNELHEEDLQARSCQSSISILSASSCIESTQKVYDMVQAFQK